MTTATQNEVSCPKCGGQMWDNRAGKKNPKAPDFKCRNRSCDGVIWPPRNAGTENGSRAASAPRGATPQGVNLGHTGIAELDAEVAADEQRFIETVHGLEPVVPSGKERLARIFQAQDACFTHALRLAAQAEAAGIPVSLEGVSALTAQALIAFKDGR